MPRVAGGAAAGASAASNQIAQLQNMQAFLNKQDSSHFMNQQMNQNVGGMTLTTSGSGAIPVTSYNVSALMSR